VIYTIDCDCAPFQWIDFVSPTGAAAAAAAAAATEEKIAGASIVLI
jgi:hypothetical protein